MGDSMPQWMQDLTAGWPMIRTNLPTFFVIVGLIVGVVWWIMDWRYGGIITNKDSEIVLAKSQRDDYRDKMGGATPDQAKARVDALEHTVRMTIGARWEPLTKAEIAVLVPKLKAIQKSRIQIMYENALGKELAQSFLEAFKEAGWDGAWMSTGSGFGDEVLIGWSSRAVGAKEAIESSSKIKVRAKDTEKEISDLIFLGVGINSY